MIQEFEEKKPETSETTKLKDFSNEKTKEIKETIEDKTPMNKTEFEDLDEDFMPIYGENPQKDSVLKILKERSKAYKDCKNYTEATEVLKKNNPRLLKWLQEKKPGNEISNDSSTNEIDEKIKNKNFVEDDKNEREVDEYLAEKWYAEDDKKKWEGTEEAERKRQEKKEIARKKKELLEKDKTPKSEEKPKGKVEETKKKKERKWDLNPLNRARYTGTRILSGVGGFGSRIAAKVNASIARPQDIFHPKYRTDMGKNIMKTPKAMLKSITGGVYKPHRKETQFEDIYKGYNPTRWPGAKKQKTAKNVVRGVGKIAGFPVAGGIPIIPKFMANLTRGINHAVHETFEGIKDSKWHRNPKKWNLKTFKYSKTKEGFQRAFSRDKKPEVMA